MEINNLKLKQVGNRTYIIKGRTNTGLFNYSHDKVVLIDTGFNGSGKLIEGILKEHGWTLEYIINTHSHIDHVGGNEYLMKKYDIPAYMTKPEIAIASFPELEAAYMNGGYPARRLRNGFNRPEGLNYLPIEDAKLDGIEFVNLPGHSPGMIGVKTSDDIWFLGDGYLSQKYLSNHMFGYIYQIDTFVESLHKMSRLEGKLFIPAHGAPENNIQETIAMNVDNIHGIEGIILDICNEFIGIDDILKILFEKFNLQTGVGYYAMLSSTTRSFLSYLQDKDELQCQFLGNVNKWCKK